MKLSHVEQRSKEWFDLRKGKIGGTRFGQVISGKKNRLVYDLVNETLSEFLFPEDYISEEMQFGIDNEDDARELYSKQSGIEFKQVGAILSDYSPIHLHSPDGLSDDGIVLEVKSTQDGGIHIQRFFEKPESSYKPQIINPFVCSDEVKEVHWISYCPERTERPIVSFVFYRSDFADEIEKYRRQIKDIEAAVSDKVAKFVF